MTVSIGGGHPFNIEIQHNRSVASRLEHLNETDFYDLQYALSYAIREMEAHKASVK